MQDDTAISAAQMKMVLGVSRMLTVTTDLNLLLGRIAQAATQLLGCERASIFLHDAATDQLWTKIALDSAEIRVSSRSGIVGKCFGDSQVIRVDDPYAHPLFNPQPDRASGFRTRNMIAAPMLDLDQKPVAVLQAINKIGGPFSPVDAELAQLLADQAGVAIQRHALQQELEKSAQMRREMDLARKIQEALIPSCPPGIKGLRCAGWTRAASVTGGDCFDLWQLPDGRLGVFLGDASGHGIGPALVVSQTRTLVRVLCEDAHTPHSLFGRVNARLSADLDGERFCTAFLGFIAPDGLLHWTSAGQGPILWRIRAEAPLHAPQTPSPPLGIGADAMDGDAPHAVRLDAGGSLIVISDGIFEAPNPAGELYGAKRAIEVLDAHRAAPPDHQLGALREAIERWQQRPEPEDDQTIVVIQVAGEEN